MNMEVHINTKMGYLPKQREWWGGGQRERWEHVGGKITGQYLHAVQVILYMQKKDQ